MLEQQEVLQLNGLARSSGLSAAFARRLEHYIDRISILRNKEPFELIEAAEDEDDQFGQLLFDLEDFELSDDEIGGASSDGLGTRDEAWIDDDPEEKEDEPLVGADDEIRRSNDRSARSEPDADDGFRTPAKSLPDASSPGAADIAAKPMKPLEEDEGRGLGRQGNNSVSDMSSVASNGTGVDGSVDLGVYNEHVAAHDSPSSDGHTDDGNYPPREPIRDRDMAPVDPEDFFDLDERPTDVECVGCGGYVPSDLEPHWVHQAGFYPLHHACSVLNAHVNTLAGEGDRYDASIVFWDALDPRHITDPLGSRVRQLGEMLGEASRRVRVASDETSRRVRVAGSRGRVAIASVRSAWEAASASTAARTGAAGSRGP